MKSFMLQDEDQIQKMRDLRGRLASRSTVVDFEEQIQLSSIRAATRLWERDDKVVAFAFVDEYNNLWFETEVDPASLDDLENEIMEWGLACIKSRNTDQTLDCVCDAGDLHRLAVLRKHGFTPQTVRSLGYIRPLEKPVAEFPLPAGFSIRSTSGFDEVEQLVALHQAAFATRNMTIEYRLAMMHAPGYVSELDLVVVAPDGSPVSFCVCGFDDPGRKIAYTDPIGTHPSFQRMGLGRAVVSAGLIALKKAGADSVRLGTSSENIAMQKLAGSLGFMCVSEKLWFSRAVA